MAGHADAADGKLILVDHSDTQADSQGVVEYDSEVNDTDGETADSSASKRPISRLRLAALLGFTMVVALGGLTGWLGFRAYQSHQADQQRQLFLQVARQGALNLTTIDWEHADADVQRILDTAAGTFHDDFATRSQPFVDMVKKVQSKSVGTVTEAGVESLSDDGAEVIVTMSVKTTVANQPDQGPRSWRMRISVLKVGDDQAKVSNVVFVP
jgi:Mce-associated membrane protein